jgi:hypothetical protein
MDLFSTGADEDWQQIGFHEVAVSERVGALPKAPQAMQYKKLGWFSTEVARRSGQMRAVFLWDAGRKRRLLRKHSLHRMKDTLAEESEAGLSVHLTLDKLELGHMAFDHSVVDRPS